MKQRKLTLQRILLLVLVAALLGEAKPTPTAAQSDEREAGEIWAFRTLYVLPAGIRFWIRVEAPADQIEAIDIGVYQNEKAFYKGPLDLESAIIFGYEDAIEYEYFLDVQENTNFEMFSPIKLTLAVTLTDGTVNQNISEWPAVHQGGGTWTTAVASDQLTIHLSDDALAIDRIAEDVLPVFTLLNESLGTVEPLNLAVYLPPLEPFCDEVKDEDGNVEILVLSERQNYPCSEQAMLDLYARTGIKVVQLNSTSFADVRDELAGAIAILQFEDQWGPAEIPAWFYSGFAQYFSINGRPDALPIAQQASQRGDLLNIQALNLRPSEEQQELWEAQAFLLTLYLADQFGADAPQQIAAQITPDNDFETVLRSQYEVSSAGLYAAWAIWLDSSRAVEVAAYHPYLENTATPTPIPSITPTRTPSITPSPTLTPSATPLFRPTNPPIPTRARPSATPTITPTPLPPGSLDVIEPTAIPASNEESGNSQLCNTGLGALFLPIIGLLVGWRNRRAKR